MYYNSPHWDSYLRSSWKPSFSFKNCGKENWMGLASSLPASTQPSFHDTDCHGIHRKQLHSGVNVVVTLLRQTFWITSIRQYVKKLLRGYVTCRKVEGTTFRAPNPAPLPKLRVQEATPFSVKGVDFTWPLYVPSENGITKSYICLFTCAVTRAVHLEVVSDLSEKSFLQAFQRFSSRRSLPHHMILDASTFLSSSETLNDLFQSPSLKEKFGQQGVLSGNLSLKDLRGTETSGRDSLD